MKNEKCSKQCVDCSFLENMSVTCAHCLSLFATFQMVRYLMKFLLFIIWYVFVGYFILINNLLTSNIQSLREDLKPQSCRVNLAVAQLTRQGLGLRFFCQGLTLLISSY